jgi:catechol 2,3-dioxygenase
MTPIDPTLRIRSVALAVSELERSVDFYERVLGVPLIASERHRAELGADPELPALVLEDIAAPTSVPVGGTGLFHVAWLHPSRASLAASVKRVASAGWRFEGAADHGVSEALYLSDPDGLGIELYADRPHELWQRPADGHGVRMVTLALDLEDLLAQHADEPTPAMAPGTAVGHVHLKVADVPRANAFYRDALGFEEQAQLPSAAFLSAGGYHHHVGLNSWQSRGALPAPDSAPGLRSVEFELASSEELDALERRLAHAPAAPSGARAENGALTVRDPDGELLAFTRSSV